MLAKLRPHLTYANVMVTILTFLALSTGGAYASHELIFTDDIVDGEVKNPDLGTDAVSTTKIQTQGVTNADLAPNTVTATRLATDSVETSEIKAGNVFNADIAGETITESRIGPDAVGASEVKPNSLTGDELNELAVPVTRGAGVLTGGSLTMSPSTSPVLRDRWSGASPSHFVLWYECPSTPESNNGGLFFSNIRNQGVHLFMDDGATTGYQTVPATTNFENSTPLSVAPTDLVSVHARWDDNHVLTASIAVRHFAASCHVQTQGALSEEDSGL